MLYLKIIFFLIILIGNLNANSSFVRGTVVSEQSEPMAGANIIIENTSRGVITDSEGKFLIDSLLPGAYTFTVDYIGCLLYTSPSPRDLTTSRMPSSA